MLGAGIKNEFDEEEATHLPTPPPSDTGTADASPNLTDKQGHQDIKVTPKKRGRPKKPTGEENEGQAKVIKTEQEPTDAEGKKPKRGRKSGSTTSGGFTIAQEALIKELFTSPEYEKLGVQQKFDKFENVFQTGKSKDVFRMRWYKLKDEAIVLSKAEETALRKAIEIIETNKALAVLNEYTKSGEGFTKLSQAFIWKKMKEWAGAKNGEGE
ncbi:hypothetical protein H072_6180 [Dactylellina haptotyla CBS 200.50]|uniref:Myb-like domain-containing protein n=1 Tax=Dactylellina haptotyla (strain CBS 200.50) TaxID=1284197 RepID=S8AAU8_DACHA|nr:hypothetical protein H072_6180 [Dactylellina haptotyla CBS 200.50]